jgi:hypothetical protein
VRDLYECAGTGPFRISWTPTGSPSVKPDLSQWRLQADCAGHSSLPSSAKSLVSTGPSQFF